MLSGSTLSALDAPSISAAVALVSLAIVLISCLRSYARLRHLPGPRSGAFSKLWMVRATASGQMHLWLADACNEYGRLVRIGPNDLVTDDGEILRKISGVRSPYIRSNWYNATAFSHDLNHAFCERDEQRHNELRNRLIPGYSGKNNDSLEERIDDRIVDLCSLIRRKYTSSASELHVVDLARICSFFTLDVIFTIAFGESMGFLASDEDVHGYLANQKAMLPVFEWFSTLPSLERFIRLKWISKVVMPRPTDRTGIGLLMGVAKRIVASRYDGKETRRDMLGSFVEHGLSQREAEMEAVLQIIAGSDTTATSIRMTLFFIITTPKVYSKLKHELGRAEEEHIVSSPVIQYAETQKLPYLEACVKEGLRMWPPVLGLMSKQVPPCGDYLDGRFVPGGTNVGYCAWGLFRKKDTFGTNAHIFRPERWIEGSEPQLAEMNRTLDLVFGWGKYSCLGKPIAWMEMRKAIAELMRRYDIAVVDPLRPFDSVNRNGLFIQESMMVTIEDSGKM